MLSDYRDSVPEFVLDAVPGARELTDALTAAEATRATAASKLGPTGAALTAVSVRNGDTYAPATGVKYADFTRAHDARTKAEADLKTAEHSVRRAQIARYEHVREGMHHPEFVAQHEALLAASVDRATAAVEALRAAVTERDELARDILGRQINVPGGWFGLSAALRDVEGYIAATLVDEDASAWAMVSDALSTAIAPTAAKVTALEACQRIRASDASAADKRSAYLDALGASGITRARR